MQRKSGLTAITSVRGSAAQKRGLHHTSQERLLPPWAEANSSPSRRALAGTLFGGEQQVQVEGAQQGEDLPPVGGVDADEHLGDPGGEMPPGVPGQDLAEPAALPGGDVVLPAVALLGRRGEQTGRADSVSSTEAVRTCRSSCASRWTSARSPIVPAAAYQVSARRSRVSVRVTQVDRVVSPLCHHLAMFDDALVAEPATAGLSRRMRRGV